MNNDDDAGLNEGLRTLLSDVTRRLEAADVEVRRVVVPKGADIADVLAREGIELGPDDTVLVAKPGASGQVVIAEFAAAGPELERVSAALEETLETVHGEHVRVDKRELDV